MIIKAQTTPLFIYYYNIWRERASRKTKNNEGNNIQITLAIDSNPLTPSH